MSSLEENIGTTSRKSQSNQFLKITILSIILFILMVFFNSKESSSRRFLLSNSNYSALNFHNFHFREHHNDEEWFLSQMGLSNHTLNCQPIPSYISETPGFTLHPTAQNRSNMSIFFKPWGHNVRPSDTWMYSALRAPRTYTLKIFFSQLTCVGLSNKS